MRLRTSTSNWTSLAVFALVGSLLIGGQALGFSPESAGHNAVKSSEPHRQFLVLHLNLSPRQTDRCIGCGHDARIIERWSEKHYPETYAGVYIEARRDPQLIVGYVSSQAARVKAVKRLPSLTVPERVFGFPAIPKYSLNTLKALRHRIEQEVVLDDDYSHLVVGLEVLVRANRVDVRSERVRKLRRLLDRLFGATAPIRVRYEEAPVPT